MTQATMNTDAEVFREISIDTKARYEKLRSTVAGHLRDLSISDDYESLLVQIDEHSVLSIRLLEKAIASPDPLSLPQNELNYLMASITEIDTYNDNLPDLVGA